MSSSYADQSYSISSTPLFYSLENVFEFHEISWGRRWKILFALQKTAQKVAKRALKVSCAVSADTAYFRKSVNQIPLPVFRNHLKDHFMIVKIELKPELGDLSDPKGAFNQGSWKKVYFAIKINAFAYTLGDLMQECVYTWGKWSIPSASPPESAMQSSSPVTSQESIDRFRSEPGYYQLLSGPASVLYHGTCVFHIKKPEKTTEKVGLMMEYCHNTVLDWVNMNKFQTMPFDQLCQFIKHLLDILRILEQHQLQHHDLKLENILIDVFGVPKLCDYGLVADLKEKNLFKSPRGSLINALPEESGAYQRLLARKTQQKIDALSGRQPGPSKADDIFEEGVFSLKGDVFAMGMVVHYICFKMHPQDSWESKMTEQTYYYQNLLTRPKETETLIQSQLRKFKRTQVFNSEFVPLLLGMLKFDPNKRFDASQCLTALNTIRQAGRQTGCTTSKDFYEISL